MRPGLALLLLLGATGGAPGAGAAECGQGEFRCGDGGCVAGAWVCDGRAECGDGSDETPDACRSVSCSPSEFSCGGRRRRCVPASWRCDGHRDCDNGSDELDCPPRTCGEDQLRCGDGACVLRAFACDGERDCEDGADEAGCPPPAAACGPHAFACAAGGCVPRLWACDGDPDCDDGSDEGPAACGTSPRPPPPAPGAAAAACPPLQFACGSGECVHRRWRCDRSPDCRDGSDEEGCAPPATCRPDQFQCGDGRCVLGVRQCDGEADCADGSDEEGCHNVTACDGRHQFQCRSGECIPAERVCDSKRDCRDWSDEPLKECGVNECLEGGGGCAHLCQDLPLGFRCLCPPGFALRPDGRSCEDIDECQDPQSCSQRCLNFPGGFECRCQEGYGAAPQNGCRALGPPAALLISNRHEVRRLALGGGGEGRVLGPLKHAGALDVDVAAGALYWADRAGGAIRRSPLPGAANGSHDAAVTAGSQDAAATVTNGSHDAAVTAAVAVAEAWADGLALDWIHQLLYWADARRGTLWVGDVGGTRRAALLREEGAQPRAIALDPLNGYMYWTDWGASAKIGKGGMNGADQFALVTQGLEWPSGIALDLPSQRLYWADARLHALSSVDTDGGRRRTLLADPQLLAHPFAVAVFEDWVFWSDVPGRAVLSASRRSGAHARRVAPGLASPGDLAVLHPLRQPPGPRRCPAGGGGCAFLCLPAPRLGPRGPRYTCACAPGLRLAPDGRRCSEPPAAAPSAPPGPSQPPTPGPAPHSRGATPGPAPGNGTAGGDAVGQGGPRPGVTALAVVLPLVLLLLAAVGARGLWRSWGGRSTHSISFSNPLFQKPGGEGGPFGSASHQALTLDEDGVA